MILAAADYALDTGDPPPELSLAFSCRRWNSLPETGGLLDQPAGLMNRLSIAENVYNSFHGWTKAENGTQFLQDNPQAEKIVNQVNKLRADMQGGDNDG